MKNGSRGKILISDGEHSSVANAAKKLEDDGFTVLKVPTRGGVLDLDFIRENADNNTVLASFMLANNETGAIYGGEPFFSLKLRYEGEHLAAAALNGKQIL